MTNRIPHVVQHVKVKLYATKYHYDRFKNSKVEIHETWKEIANATKREYSESWTSTSTQKVDSKQHLYVYGFHFRAAITDNSSFHTVQVRQGEVHHGDKFSEGGGGDDSWGDFLI